MHAGILDSHTLMSALLADIEAHRGVMAVASKVVGGRVAVPAERITGGSSCSTGDGSTDAAGSTVSSSGTGVLLEVEDLQAGGRSWLHASTVVNSAGVRCRLHQSSHLMMGHSSKAHAHLLPPS